MVRFQVRHLGWWLSAAGAAAVLAMQRGGGVAYSSQVRAIARAISVAEGTFRADGSGNPAARGYQQNNPGDIEDSAGNLRTYGTMQDGWNALYSQVSGMLDGSSAVYSPDMPLIQVASMYTGNDNAAGWAAAVAQQLGASVGDAFGSLGVA